jgi:hypothetical protein
MNTEILEMIAQAILALLGIVLYLGLCVCCVGGLVLKRDKYEEGTYEERN